MVRNNMPSEKFDCDQTIKFLLLQIIATSRFSLSTTFLTYNIIKRQHKKNNNQT